MRKWSVGTNDYYFTSSIYLEEAPWYIFTLDIIIPWICDYFPRIPLPKINIIRDGEKTNLKEYYGTARDLFHCFVCSKITNWCFKKTKTQIISFPYEKLMKIFPEEFKNNDDDDIYNDEDEKRTRNLNYEYSKKIGKEFMISYNKLHNIGNVRMKEIKRGEKNENKS
jgi:hypothetical protein